MDNEQVDIRELIRRVNEETRKATEAIRAMYAEYGQVRKDI